jgi:glycosyltransferase involved in cell wall biosynthesis
MLFVIPAHNEAASLPRTIAELRAHHPEAEILVVDDGSTDGTQAAIAPLGVHCLRLAARLGVGSAMRAGIRWAAARGATLVVRVDADGQHAADDIEALARPVRDGRAAATVGSRYLSDAGWRARGMRRVAQRLLAAVLSRVVHTRVTDPTSGFWAFGPEAIALLAEHHPAGYGEPELRLLLARRGLAVEEVPVSMRPRAYGVSTITWTRAVGAAARALMAIVVVPRR